MATSWNEIQKPGTGLEYDNSNEYDAATDADSGFSMSYDTVGAGASWSNESKP